MIKEEILQDLYKLQDKNISTFEVPLFPGKDPQSFIGVRTPELRKLARKYAKREDLSEFLCDLPHAVFEEDQLHAFCVSEIKDMDRCLQETERFLPYIDNWGTCDQFSPKVFAKHLDILDGCIRRWIAAEHQYTVRYGIGMRMRYFLDEHFKEEYHEAIAMIDRDEYYIRMMIAWYFATALAKQYEKTLPYLTENRLPLWVHNKTIQKTVESYRINPEQKEFLKTLRRKKDR